MIQCNNVKKTFRKKQVLANVSLSITAPKIVALVGRNGAGKSTLLKLLAGRLNVTAGEILIAGKNPFNQLSIATNTMFMNDSVAFPINLTLQEILEAAQPFYPNWQQQLAEKLLAYVELNPNDYYKRLSKGQAAAFRLIYSVCARCKYTYLDEPMNGLDESVRADLYRYILKDFIAYPRLMIISTHYLNEIRHLAEEVVVLHDGEIIMHMTIDELSQYALKVTGPKEAVYRAIGEAPIIKCAEKFNLFEAYIVATNIDQSQLANITVQQVAPNEVITVLTSNHQGGIDDVYEGTN